MSTAEALKVAIRTLDNTSYRCGKLDGQDEPSPSLQVKYAGAATKALVDAISAADAALTDAYAEGRKDEREESAGLLKALQNLLEVWPNKDKKPGWCERWEAAKRQGAVAIAKYTGEQ